MLMVMAIVGLGLLVLGGGTGIYRKAGFIYWKLLVVVFVVSFIRLTLLGGEIVEFPYELLGFIFTVVYFGRLVIMVGVGSLGVVYK